jgi:hypothetical protein
MEPGVERFQFVDPGYQSPLIDFSKMQNVSEDVLRVIGTNRTWLKNYGIVLGLVKNAKTPAAISMHLLQRLTERDMKMLAVDRNVPEALRLAARKFIVKGFSVFSALPTPSSSPRALP